MAPQIVWLDGPGVDATEVGARAAALALLRVAGLQVPRGFALGRTVLAAFAAAAARDAANNTPAKIPAELHQEMSAAIRELGGSVAIRRSPLAESPPDESWQVITQGGRPERETYLHLTDVAEVSEAVRRIWGASRRMPSTSPPPPVAIVVQRFVLPDVCAIVRSEKGVPDQLSVLSSLGIGDLLAAGLVVPDRHSIRRDDGVVASSSLGRKAQMTVPRPDGGVMRVPVPAAAARRMALDEPKLVELATLWRHAEEVLGTLHSLAAAWSLGRWFVTTAVPGNLAEEEGLMLG